MTIKLIYVETNTLYNSMVKSIKNSLKKELNKYDKLTPEVLIDIQGEVDKQLRKEFVLTGKALDFRAEGFSISKDLKTISIVCVSYIPSWYAHEESKDSLSCDPILDYEGFKVKIPETVQVDEDDFMVDVTDYEKIRDEECDSYAEANDFKRFACSKYVAENNYFVSVD